MRGGRIGSGEPPVQRAADGHLEARRHRGRARAPRRRRRHHAPPARSCAASSTDSPADGGARDRRRDRRRRRRARSTSPTRSATLLQDGGPGATHTLTVERPAGTDTRSRSTSPPIAAPDDPDRAIIGIQPEDRIVGFDFPIDVDIDSGTVGGPSAGLAFTSRCSTCSRPGELTGGHRVAVTGTMDLDGHGRPGRRRGPEGDRRPERRLRGVPRAVGRARGGAGGGGRRRRGDRRGHPGGRARGARLPRWERGVAAGGRLTAGASGSRPPATVARPRGRPRSTPGSVLASGCHGRPARQPRHRPPLLRGGSPGLRAAGGAGLPARGLGAGRAAPAREPGSSASGRIGAEARLGSRPPSPTNRCCSRSSARRRHACSPPARDAAAEIRAKAEAAAERIITDATVGVGGDEGRCDPGSGSAARRGHRRERRGCWPSARTELERRSAEAEEAAAPDPRGGRRRGAGPPRRGPARPGADPGGRRRRGRGGAHARPGHGGRGAGRARARAARPRRATQEGAPAGREAQRRTRAAARGLRRSSVARSTRPPTSSARRCPTRGSAADAAARRIEEEPDPTIEELDEEVTHRRASRPAHRSRSPRRTTTRTTRPVRSPARCPRSCVDPVDRARRRGAAGRPGAGRPRGAPGPQGSSPQGDLRGPAAGGLLQGRAAPPEGEGVRILADAAARPEPAATEEPVERRPSDRGRRRPSPTARRTAPAAVEDVFARLRAEQATTRPATADADSDAPKRPTGGDPAPEVAEVAEEPEPEEGEPEPEAATPFTERDALLDPIDKELARRLKRGARRRAERGARPAPAGQAEGRRRRAPRSRRRTPAVGPRW